MRCNVYAKAERQGEGGLPCCKEIALAKNLATNIGSPQPRADDRAYSQGSLHCNTGNCVLVSLAVMCSWLRPANITSQPYKRGRTQQVVGVLTYLKTGLTANTSEFIESGAESINVLEQVKKQQGCATIPIKTHVPVAASNTTHGEALRSSHHVAALPDSRPKRGAKCPAPTPARVCTSCPTGWPSDATSRPQIQSVQQVQTKQPIANTITQRGVQQVSFPGDSMRVEV